MNRVAGKSFGRSAISRFSATPLPAEPPMTMMSRLAIAFPGFPSPQPAPIGSGSSGLEASRLQVVTVHAHLDEGLDQRVEQLLGQARGLAGVLELGDQSALRIDPGGAFHEVPTRQ